MESKSKPPYSKFPAAIDFSSKEGGMILETNPSAKHFGIQRKPLPVEHSGLLYEANRRRASLSAGNMLEIFAIDGLWNFKN
ncbi:hypothetical protein FNV43_RR04595 [Rhamnella rubrinervis]|uniref:Uncharacterized protein n=1 Tax=Rhamnella rubrinervis TaxID=2594499 RepID=A0A8K0MQE4_9ROSA|nr:hypothetical protein FNV43_RR04595 [Rhamnella rubrinervis]